MFDLHWTELILVMLVTLLVVGPKDLPKVMRTVGAFVHKLRSMAAEFQSGLDQIAREAELDELKKQAEQARNATGESVARRALDPDGRLDLPRGPASSSAVAGQAKGDAAPSQAQDSALEGDGQADLVWPDGSGDAAPVDDTADVEETSRSASADSSDATHRPGDR